MEGNRVALKAAITTSDVEAFTALLSAQDRLSIRAIIRKNEDEEDLISLAVRLGRHEMAVKLLIKSSINTDLPYEEFTWLKLFDLASAPSLSSGNIIKRLKYATPLIARDDFPMLTLAHKPKYLKAAFTLGAVCTDEKELGLAIMQSNMKFKDKMRMLNWLKDNNYTTKQIVPVSQVFHHLKESTEFEEYLQRYPDWFLEQDSSGNNILHYATRHARVRVVDFERIWKVMKKHATDVQKLIAAALQTNQAGEIPAITYLSKYLGSLNTYPVEFLAALKIIVEQDETNTAWQKFIENWSFSVQNMTYTMLFFYLLQHCQPHNAQAIRQHLQKMIDRDDFTELFHCIDKPKKQEELSESANITINGSHSLFDLPKDLYKEIAMHLAPHDLTRLYSCSKTLHEEFKTILFNQDEQLWRHYHVKYFKHVEDVTLPYRTRVQRLLKLNSSWQQNKYSAVAELKGNPLMLNDDWLVLKGLDSNYNTTHVSYWNCHSQQFSDISHRTTHRSFITILKDTNNEAARVPKVLLARRNENLNFVFTILSETESPVLKNLAIRSGVKDLAGITSIDATSIFCPSVSCVYNIEQEIVTAELHTKENEIATFNPFNNTIVTVSSTSARSHYTVTDLRTMKDIWVPQKSSKSSNTMTIRYTKIVDENTMLILGYAPDYLRGGRYGRLTTAVGFVDLRTGSETEIVKYALRPNYINYENVPCSNERLFIHTQNAPIVSSWHLPSRKIEWLQPTEHIPKMANARYLVLSDRDDTTTYIRDYLSWGSEEVDPTLKL